VVNQLVARKLLQPLFEVDIANNGKESIDYLENGTKKYVAIFMDITMPVMDGFEATSKIRSMPQWRGTPIIACTALMIASRQQCISFGMDEYIPKPIQVTSLYLVLQNLHLITPEQIAEYKGTVK